MLRRMDQASTHIAAVVALFAACLTAASDDTALSRLHVTHDETTGEPDTAGIMLFDRTADGTGHASLTCLDHQPAPDLTVLVYEPRPAERLAEHTSETPRVHVDAQPMWRLGPGRGGGCAADRRRARNGRVRRHAPSRFPLGAGGRRTTDRPDRRTAHRLARRRHRETRHRRVQSGMRPDVRLRPHPRSRRPDRLRGRPW